MLYRKLKIGLLVIAVLLLSSCHQRAQYTYLLQHPQHLQSILSGCAANSQTQECVDARVVAEVFNEYMAIGRAHQQQLQANRGVILQLQQQQFRPQNAMQRQVLNQFENAQTDIQEQFGQKIIAAQSRLVDLQTSLQKATDSDAKDKIKAAIAHQKRLIQVMYAMVMINEPTE